MKFLTVPHSIRPEIEMVEIRTDDGRLLATMTPGEHEHQMRLISSHLDGSVRVIGGYPRVYVFNFER